MTTKQTDPPRPPIPPVEIYADSNRFLPSKVSTGPRPSLFLSLPLSIISTSPLTPSRNQDSRVGSVETRGQVNGVAEGKKKRGGERSARAKGRNTRRSGRSMDEKAGGKQRNMKQSLHWKVKNLSSPSAFDLPLGASVLIVPALSSSSSSTSSSSSISCSLQSQVKCIAYPPCHPSRYVYASPVSTHLPRAL